MSRIAVVFTLVVAACTGGPGPIDSSSGSSSGGSSSGGSSSGGSSSGGASGGTSQEIRASEFSQSCIDDSDCVAVYEGSICNQCGCPNSAIAKTDIASYSSKRASAGCPETDQACVGDCAEATPICAQGTCSITRGAPSVPDGG